MEEFQTSEMTKQVATEALAQNIQEFLSVFTLRVPTSSDWIQKVEENFPLFIADHAANERKAAATAMDFVVRYPNHESLVKTASQIAQEEISHFREVFALMVQEGYPLLPDEKDVYVRILLSQVRTLPQERFLDRLLVCSLIEVRGIERFEILSKEFSREPWRAFYRRLHKSEKSHGWAFYHEATKIFPQSMVDDRMDQLLDAEARACKQTPITGKFH
ncbi:MAG: tRNA isopentenyl-2-thiomethyl-A-37 hydroxylase MiaE [Bdellovibrionota bacterium]